MYSGHPENKSATPPPNTSPTMETTTPEQDLASTVTLPTTIVQYIAVPITVVPNLAVPITIVSNTDMPINAITTPAVTTASVTINPVTTSSVTIDPVTTASVTIAPESTTPVTVEPVTVEPMTVEPVTATPVTITYGKTAHVITAPMITAPTTAAPVTITPVTNTSVTATTVPYTINIPFSINNASLNLQLTVQINNEPIQPIQPNNKPGNDLQKSEENTNAVNDLQKSEENTNAVNDLQKSEENTNAVNDNSSYNIIDRSERMVQRPISPFLDTAVDDNEGHSSKKRKIHYNSLSARNSYLECRGRRTSSSSDRRFDPRCRMSGYGISFRGRSVKGSSSNLYRRKTSSGVELERSGQKSVLTLTAASEVQIYNTNSNSLFIKPSNKVSTSAVNAETSRASSAFTRVETPMPRAPITYPGASSHRKNNKHLLDLLNSDSGSNNGVNGAIVKKQ